MKAFKLFIVDVGLLGAMVGLNQRTFLNGNELFTEFKGALTEQYVMQQLAVNQDLGIYYYTNDRNICEKVMKTIKIQHPMARTPEFRKSKLKDYENQNSRILKIESK